MWIVYLAGQDVRQGVSIIGYIDDINKADKVVEDVGNTYNIEFVLDRVIGSREYINTTDDRKIYLVIEPMDELEVR